MCGIIGMFQSQGSVAEAELHRMNDAQRYRGPDDASIWISADRHVGLGHRRLSIVELSPLGRQPMRSRSGRYVTVFNGEIYNFQDLRRELDELGHSFIGSSDTEVMLAGLDEWGLHSAVTRFNGMFAVAVWDQQDGRLHLFRDRLGVKPLYYQWHRGGFCFSSELTPEFASIGAREIDLESLALFFRYNCIPGSRSIYKSIRKLTPGVIATLSSADVAQGRFGTLHEYWNTSKRINQLLSERGASRVMTEGEALDALDHCLRRSVQQRMIADVPLGAFLSGGIDSSLIVSYMTQLSAKPVKTFTIGFNDKQFNEAESAKAIARHLCTDHTECYVTEKDALAVIPLLPRMYGEPFADSSQIPTYIVSNLTRRQVTVALSGDGGDELFAGYRYYQTIAKLNPFQCALSARGVVLLSKLLALQPVHLTLERAIGDQKWGRITKILRLLAQGEEPRVPVSLNAHLSRPEKLVRHAPPGSSLRLFDRCEGSFVEQSMCDDLMNYLPDDILAKVDRASMANSLEIRAPFVDDYELLETAWRIPMELKQRPGASGKLILKKLLARHIPASLFDFPKQGFGIPLVQWLNGPLRPWVEECTADAGVRAEGYLEPAVIADVRRRTESGDSGYAYTLWAICNFQSWLRTVHNGQPWVGST
ncbi:MAG: asparagine synthase (glutamine-hydrolyzing) [Deltaproteobacteria bacterium]|nr:asparagine synthase (glutamine-hydrolyzing) [Deltaproteobacteria bacterium]